MDRYEFRRLFRSSGPVVLPVIHVIDAPQVERNVEVALGEGAPGVFLINHDFEKERLVPIIEETRSRYPDLWLAVNFLAVTGLDAFPILDELQERDCAVDGYWGDDARIDERKSSNEQTEAQDILRAKSESDWTGLYFGGTAFKKQREVNPEDLGRSAELAVPFMDVVTTSGKATGVEADLDKISVFRRSIGNAPMAIASGITPENAENYREADCYMVATGININGDFYNIEPARLARLMKVARNLGRENA